MCINNNINTVDPQHEFDAFTEDIVIEKRPLTKEELEAEKKKFVW